MNKEQGLIGLYVTIIVLLLMVGIIASIGFGVLVQQRMILNITQSAQAYAGAESGIEDATYRIKMGRQYTTNYTISVNATTVEVAISGSNTKTITSEASARNIFRSVETVLTLSAVSPQFFYGVQAGEGGVRMYPNSRIEGVGGIAGNFYSNGPVVGDSNALITGDVIVAQSVTLDTQFTDCNTDQVVGQSNPQIDFAQSFTPSDTQPLGKISLYLKKVGNPGDRTIRITTDVAGSPADFDIADATLRADLVTTNYGWIDIVFLYPATLTANTTYWIVFDTAQHSTKYWIWCKDASAGYANGSAKYSKDWDDDPWSSIAGDFTFKTYLGGGVSSIEDVIVHGDVYANTITNSFICGDAHYASMSSIDGPSKNFLDSPTNPTCGGNPLTPGTGYPDQPDPPVSPMPISEANVAEWKQDAQAGGTIQSYTAPNNASVTLGPIEITENLDLTANNKTLTVTGTIYVHGNIDIANNSTIRCSPSYGPFSCVIVADGWIHVDNNVNFSGSGQPGSYIMLLTTVEGCLGVFVPGCTDNGNGIDIQNNATGAIFYATNSMIELFNNVNISEVTAYKIGLRNNAVVTYESGLLISQFTSGPGAGWEVTSWKEIE